MNEDNGTSTALSSKPSSLEQESVGKQELISIAALVEYVAHEQNSDCETIHSIVLTRFSVDHLTQLRKMDYDNALKFLVDLRVNEVLN